MEHIAIGEVELGVETSGAGAPLVLLPGLGMRLEHWAPHLPAFGAVRRVIALDVRGGADSVSPPGPYTIADMAGDTLAALDALGLDRVDLLGMSMGGFVAQEVALARPSRVRSLVLALTARCPSARGRERLRVELTLRERPELHELHVRNVFLWLLDDATYRRRDALERLVRAATAAAAAEPLDGVRGRVEACLAYQGSPLLGELAVPTLVVGAEHDLIYPPQETAALAAAIPGARHLVIDAAHLLTGPAIRRFDEAVVDFLGEPSP